MPKYHSGLPRADGVGKRSPMGNGVSIKTVSNHPRMSVSSTTETPFQQLAKHRSINYRPTKQQPNPPFSHYLNPEPIAARVGSAGYGDYWRGPG